jgi:NAD(P)-dependent dehydrogenase (short-subunit alcohol dehydrogenase family)
MSHARSALITGGGSGIGLAAAEHLLAHGWRVLIADHDQTALERSQRMLTGHDPALRLMQIDVADEDAVTQLVAEAQAEMGPLRGLVNCAGVAPTTPFLETEMATFRRVLEVNLVGTFLVGRVTATAMARSGGGAIVNVASVSGFRGSPGRAAYGASKGGVITLTKVMALELAPHGIRVNCVAPGATETPLLEQIHTPQTRAGVLAAVPLGRFAQPTETAAAIRFLLEEASSFITGHSLIVDGGQMIGAGWSAPSDHDAVALGIRGAR